MVSKDLKLIMAISAGFSVCVNKLGLLPDFLFAPQTKARAAHDALYYYTPKILAHLLSAQEAQDFIDKSNKFIITKNFLYNEELSHHIVDGAIFCYHRFKCFQELANLTKTLNSGKLNDLELSLCAIKVQERVTNILYALCVISKQIFKSGFCDETFFKILHDEYQKQLDVYNNLRQTKYIPLDTEIIEVLINIHGAFINAAKMSFYLPYIRSKEKIYVDMRFINNFGTEISINNFIQAELNEENIKEFYINAIPCSKIALNIIQNLVHYFKDNKDIIFNVEINKQPITREEFSALCAINAVLKNHNENSRLLYENSEEINMSGHFMSDTVNINLDDYTLADYYDLKEKLQHIKDKTAVHIIGIKYTYEHFYMIKLLMVDIANYKNIKNFNAWFASENANNQQNISVTNLNGHKKIIKEIFSNNNSIEDMSELFENDGLKDENFLKRLIEYLLTVDLDKTSKNMHTTFEIMLSELETIFKFHTKYNYNEIKKATYDNIYAINCRCREDFALMAWKHKRALALQERALKDIVLRDKSYEQEQKSESLAIVPYNKLQNN